MCLGKDHACLPEVKSVTPDHKLSSFPLLVIPSLGKFRGQHDEQSSWRSMNSCPLKEGRSTGSNLDMPGCLLVNHSFTLVVLYVFQSIAPINLLNILAMTTGRLLG
ncbi:hypothetical protein GOODEAATRI_021954 [Goodea atripinnis]|uniref:Uncharacterized protein n=1 Tax=Goodea atripinnis TaxID=208336 RepID=A0ABV0NM91_9TELE